MVKRLNGETEMLAHCVLGGNAFGANSIHEVASGDCPIDTQVQPGEAVTFAITSNLYPYFFRTYETDIYGRYVFRDATIEVLHSTENPSSVTWFQTAN